MSVVAPITALLVRRRPGGRRLRRGRAPRRPRPSSAWRSRSSPSCWCRPRAAAACARPTSAASPTRSAPASGFGLLLRGPLAHRRRLRHVAARRRPRRVGDRASARVALLGFIPRTPPDAGQPRAHRRRRRPRRRSPTSSTSSPCARACVSVVSVLAALYPVSTVVLARVVLHERFARLQVAGMALALPATILMAV